jgi:hypothetical protein
MIPFVDLLKRLSTVVLLTLGSELLSIGSFHAKYRAIVAITAYNVRQRHYERHIRERRRLPKSNPLSSQPTHPTKIRTADFSRTARTLLPRRTRDKIDNYL